MCGRTCCRGESNDAESHKHLSKPIVCGLLLSLLEGFLAFTRLIAFQNEPGTAIWEKLFNSLLPVKITFGYELNKLYTINKNCNDNIYKILTHESGGAVSKDSVSGL